MECIQTIVNEYFANNPIDVEQIKVNYKEKNKIKLMDDSTTYAFSLGVNASKLYIEELKTK